MFHKVQYSVPCYFLNDIFYFITDISIANYVDDNTPYTTKNSITSLLETLEVETNTLLDWFRNNEMKPNEDKCHLLVINQENISVNVGKENISCSSSVDLLGIKIDDKLNYILPSKKYENDLVILHVGTNDLRNPKEAK